MSDPIPSASSGSSHPSLVRRFPLYRRPPSRLAFILCVLGSNFLGGLAVAAAFAEPTGVLKGFDLNALAALVSLVALVLLGLAVAAYLRETSFAERALGRYADAAIRLREAVVARGSSEAENRRLVVILARIEEARRAYQHGLPTGHVGASEEVALRRVFAALDGRDLAAVKSSRWRRVEEGL